MFCLFNEYFPDLLRLRAPIWPVGKIALAYAIGSTFYLISVGTITFHSSNSILVFLLQLGLCIRILATLWFVSEIDLLRFVILGLPNIEVLQIEKTDLLENLRVTMVNLVISNL